MWLYPAAFILSAVSLAVSEVKLATVYWNVQEGDVTLRAGVLDRSQGDAYALYNDTLPQTGWDVLEVRAGYGPHKRGDRETLYMAGFLEGYLTANRIYPHYRNLVPFFITDSRIGQELNTFFNEQDDWVVGQIKANRGDPAWRHVDALHGQMQGLQRGVQKWALENNVKPLPKFAFHYLNGIGDIIDLVNKLSPQQARGFGAMTSGDIRRYTLRNGHCSAIIKVTPGFENVLFGHSSWFTYSATSRIFKHWDFNLREVAAAAPKSSFSSYPGFLSSLDDYYLLSSGLVMLQTTIVNYNQNLFDDITPRALLSWQRVRTANVLARDGKQWGEILAKHNSGTYNNQYMILNLNKIELGVGIHDGALYVVEQMPTLVHSADQTDILRNGYWASYNIPFYRSIYELGGYQRLNDYMGNEYSHQLSSRAKIFRRDQSKIRNVESLKAVLRYNGYKTDRYTFGNPCNTICCRDDLQPDTGSPVGCYDTKVSDMRMAKKFMTSAVNGPTMEGKLPAFSWSTFDNVKHEGLPTTYKFPFVTMQPTLFTIP